MSRNQEAIGVVLGICCLVLLHLAFVVTVSVVGTALEPPGPYRGLASFIYPVIFIGGLQLLYVWPLCVWLERKGRLAVRKGVIIAAVITAFLNASCYVIFAFQ